MCNCVKLTLIHRTKYKNHETIQQLGWFKKRLHQMFIRILAILTKLNLGWLAFYLLLPVRIRLDRYRRLLEQFQWENVRIGYSKV